MKIHIVGSGPTGLSLAWEILKFTDHEVVIHDRKSSSGGSWWEPDSDKRDLHAHRIVFDNAFVGTSQLFKEMKIDWNEIFIPVDENKFKYLFEKLKLKDIFILIKLFFKVLYNPEKYKNISLKDSLDNLSDDGELYMSTIPFIIDGVGWDVMSAYEFIKSFDHVAFSKKYTQKVSGRVMNDLMFKAVMDAGATFHFNRDLVNVKYKDDDYEAEFSDGTVINDGMLIMCIDNSKALDLIKDNWGRDAKKYISPSTYGCLNLLLDYEEPIGEIESDTIVAMYSEWKLQPVLLNDRKTISCGITNITDEIVTTDPDALKSKTIEQLVRFGIPKPDNIRIGWGSKWDGEKWSFEQSSGVLNMNGQLPFFGKCKKVAMCGMMSERYTPYSSIEASVEVSKSLCSKLFNTRGPTYPILLSHVLYFTLVLILIKLYVTYK